MGMESRDYYVDWWRKKTGYRERAQFRVPAGEEGRTTDEDADAGGEYLRDGPPDLIGVNLHWSLKLLVMLVVVVGLLALRRALT